MPATKEFFHRNKAANDGFQNYCKECVKANNKKKKSNIFDFPTNKEELISDSINAEVFQNSEFGNLRTIEINGEPCFVGKDVCECLNHTNARKAIGDHIDDEDKQIILKSQNVTLENIPNRGLTVINESGLYSLIMSSKLPSAKRFKQWVTSEVLPSIRKHGTYMTPDMLEKVLLNPDT